MSVNNIIALNRIVYPSVSLPNFIRLTSEMGFHKIELRNDLGQKNVLDSYTAKEIKEILKAQKVEVITINALQNFNVPELLSENLKELEALIKTAKAIDCSAVVFCPSNSGHTGENDFKTNKNTLKALVRFSPVLEANNITGFIEPLGFTTSSLRSITLAQKLIKESGCKSYKIVHDTFHFYLGTDNMKDLLTKYDKSLIGLVHVSSVCTLNGQKGNPERGEQQKQTEPEPERPRELTDGDRVLPDMAGGQDILKSSEQVNALAGIGYKGDISFEAFSRQVQELKLEDFKNHINKSIELLFK